MALINVKPKEDRPINYYNLAAARIQQRRYQILVHSLLYYEADYTIVSDATWSKWAADLVSRQAAYPEVANKVIFSNEFKNFTGDTGMGLPLRDAQIVSIARRLVKDQEIRDKLDQLVTTPAIYDTYKSVKEVKKSEPKRVQKQERKGLFRVSRE